MKQWRKSLIWILLYLILVVGTLSAAAIQVVKVDPFFHFHKPDTDVYYYHLNNQRSQNNGITRYFDYNALITGTSMTENFKTSEMDEIFGTNSIKVSYSGGTFKEINDNLVIALKHNSDLKTIVRGLDMEKFIEDKDAMRQDLGKYPTYLYDDNILNDVNYVFNRNVIFDRLYPMMKENDAKDFNGGITSFDTYSNWMANYTFGIKTVCPNGITVPSPGNAVHLTEEEKNIVLGTVQQNITSLADAYPDVTFYYFFTPYSAAWWQSLVNSGIIYKQIEAEKLIIEQVLSHKNIKLFSFNNLTDITTDINNYKDLSHYGSWINSLMLKYMHEGKYRLTNNNYEEYLDEELDNYLTFDYDSLNKQMDYPNDYYAEALLDKKVNGVKPLSFSYDVLSNGSYHHAELMKNEDGEPEILCQGSLQRESESDISLADYLISNDYIGCEIMVEDISDYKYLVFYGQKNQDNGRPGVFIYDADNTNVARYEAKYDDVDEEEHQYLMDVSGLTGKVKIVFNGGAVDRTGSTESLYTFRKITLY